MRLRHLSGLIFCLLVPAGGGAVHRWRGSAEWGIGHRARAGIASIGAIIGAAAASAYASHHASDR